jgi:multidrug resistance efflux pump
MLLGAKLNQRYGALEVFRAGEWPGVALLPPDKAIGNFTTIVRRVPAKIVLDDESLNGLLRPGLSAVPTGRPLACDAGTHARPLALSCTPAPPRRAFSKMAG